MPHLMLRKLLHHDGTDHAAKSPEAITDSHKDAGVPRGDIQVVHVEAWNKEDTGEDR